MMYKKWRDLVRERRRKGLIKRRVKIWWEMRREKRDIWMRRRRELKVKEKKNGRNRKRREEREWVKK